MQYFNLKMCYILYELSLINIIFIFGLSYEFSMADVSPQRNELTSHISSLCIYTFGSV